MHIRAGGISKIGGAQFKLTGAPEASAAPPAASLLLTGKGPICVCTHHLRTHPPARGESRVTIQVQGFIRMKGQSWCATGKSVPMFSSTFPPSRAMALERLDQFVPMAGRAYATGRNTDAGPDRPGAVSRLSPYLRHRLITEQEVVAHVLARHNLDAAGKFIQEVLWRTYWKGWLDMRPSVWRRFLEQRDHQRGAFHDERALADAENGQTGIEGFDDWARELVETLDAGPAILGVGEGAMIVQGVTLPVALVQKTTPDGRAHFQPALPIGAPEHLLNEFPGGVQIVPGEHMGDHFMLGDQAVTQIGGEPGDGAWTIRAWVRIAPRVIKPTGRRNELGKSVERHGARRGKG
jgi:hypothetical protein